MKPYYLLTLKHSTPDQANAPCWNVDNPQVFTITVCGTGTAADGQLLTTDSYGTDLPAEIGLFMPQVPGASYQYFIEPTMGYLCLAPTLGAPMLQLCVETDPYWCVDPYGMGIPWIQASGWWQGQSGYPGQLLSCAVDEDQLSCQYGGYDYLELGPAITDNPGWDGWYPLLSNKSSPGSQYFSTNGSCN
jgi:hypothetical protein